MATCRAQQLGKSLVSAGAAAAAAGCWGPSLNRAGVWNLPPTLRGIATSITASSAADQTQTRTFSSGVTSSQAGQASSSSSSSPSSASSTTTTTSSSSSNSNNPDADGYRVMYQGFFARPHKRLKYASLLNTFASFAAAPLIVTYSSASPVARVAVTAWVLAFAIITTGGLHWFTSPYIHQLLYNATTDMAKVQTMSFLGGSRWHEFPISAVQAADGYHPLANFKVSGKSFYVDRANFADTDLLAKLMPGSTDTSSSTSTSSGDGSALEQQKSP